MMISLFEVEICTWPTEYTYVLCKIQVSWVYHQ